MKVSRLGFEKHGKNINYYDHPQPKIDFLLSRFIDEVRKSEVLTIILLFTAIYEKVVDICSCTSTIVEIYLIQ
jgi:hypothetical protein